MKILPISVHTTQINNHKKEITNKNNSLSSTQTINFTGTPRSYISFGGGDSLDLGKTFALLRHKYELDGEEQEPFLVKQEILKELEQRNPENKTLIDVHKQVYGKLLNANDLKEIKLLYPTFRLVKSFNEVDFKDNAFVAEIKRGDNPIFNNKEDLSVQLIKLYWGEGFSLSDIAKQANTKPSTISAVMEKLNIERVTPYYGRLLKLSDREYNERFTKEMAEKMELIAAQKRGEPYIPRKPLTAEHKRRISESLIEFYAEHPERLANMSERQKEFFKNHPEEALIFRFVMYKAWNMESCAAIRRKLKSFLEQNNIQVEKQEKEPGYEYLSRLQAEKMKTFWDTHPYEKKKFAKGVQHAWDKINKHKNIELIRNTADAPMLPKFLELEIKNWAKKQNEINKTLPKAKRRNFDVDSFKPSVAYQLFDDDLINHTNEHEILNEFFKHNKSVFKVFNDAISFQIMGIHNYYKRSNNVDADLAKDIVTHINKEMNNRTKMDVNAVIKLYAEILTIVKSSGNIDDYNKILKAYDLIYNKDFNTGIFTLLNL